MPFSPNSIRSVALIWKPGLTFRVSEFLSLMCWKIQVSSAPNQRLGDSQWEPARHLWGLCVFPLRRHRLLTSVAQQLPLTWLGHLFSLSSLRASKSLFMPYLLLPTSVCNWRTTCCGRGGSIRFKTVRNARQDARAVEGAHALLFRNTAHPELSWARGLSGLGHP